MGLCGTCKERTSKRKQNLKEDIPLPSFNEYNKVKEPMKQKEIAQKSNNKKSGYYNSFNEKNNLFNSKMEKEKFNVNNKKANDSIESKISVKINTNYFYRESDSIVYFDFNKINNLSGLLNKNTSKSE